MTAAFSAVAVGLAGLSVYFAWSAGQIQQNYLQSLKNQSQYLSAESVALLENGDRVNAMLLALEALPKDDKDERPVLPEAEYALSQAVNAYVSTNENQYTVEYAFPHGGKINKILPSQDEKYLTVLHSDYAFTIWDVQTREKIHEQMLASYILDAAISYDDKLLLLSGNVLYGYDAKTGEVLWQLEVASNADAFAVSETAPIASISDGEHLVTVDTSTGQVLQEVLLPTYEEEDPDSGKVVTGSYWLKHAKFSPDNQRLFLHLDGNTDWLALWDLKTNKVNIWDISFFSVDDAFFAEDGNVVMMGKYRIRNGNYWIDPLYYYEDDYTEICCFNPEGLLLWADEIHYTEMDVGLGSECIPFTYPGNEGEIAAVAAVAGEKLNFYDIATGEIIEENAYTDAIVTLTAAQTHLSAITTNGMVGKYDFENKRNVAGDFCIEGIDLAWENEQLFVSSSDTGNVLIYTYGLHDENWTEMPMDGQIAESMFSSGEDLLVLYGVDKIYRYRVSDGAFLNKIDVDAGSVVMSDCRWDDSKPGTLALFNNDTLNLIDTERWVVRTHVPNCLSFDLQNGLIFTTMNKGTEPMKFGYYEIYDYEELIEMAKQQLDGMTLSAEMRIKYGLQ